MSGLNNDLEIYKSANLAEITADKLEEMLKRRQAEAFYWNNMTNKSTPEEYVYQREGSNGKTFDYIKQFYVIRELNRLFPGWELRPPPPPQMFVWYQPEVQTWNMVGILYVKYLSIITGKIEERNIPALGSLQVQIKTKSAETGMAMPSQPDDMFKGVRSEAIKNGAYWLGIGFDIYSQEITLESRSRFEDIIREWEFSDYVKGIAGTFKSPKAFNEFIDSLPQQKDTIRFIEILNLAKDNNIPLDRIKLWETYQKQNIKSIETFLNGLESQIKQLIKS